jgi:DMSO/TMAO reductase YedYZ molybdopterin-dependent catalytic subunit
MFADGAFPSQVRQTWVTARLGRVLGILITICFFTGLISHFHQHPVGWLPLPASPAWGFRLTQGLHVVSGLAAIPVFFAKMWSVYPHLFTWPPVRSVQHALERLSVLVLVGATLTELLTGVMNVAHIYLWPYFFPAGHYAIAWLVAGSVVLHLAVKWPRIVAALRRPRSRLTNNAVVEPAEAEQPDLVSGGISRRGVIVAAAGAAGLVALTTAGQSVRALGDLGLLAPRSPGDVPGGMPINRLASSAGVVEAASDPAYRLTVAGPKPLTLSLAELAELEQTTLTLPIACVEGWSASGEWSGVRLRDLLAMAGIDASATVLVSSLERDALYNAADVPPNFAQDPRTLLALRLNGSPLSIDHGYPVRLIAPNRPGVLQTKWVSQVTVI